jgi:hypothetical protein
LKIGNLAGMGSDSMIPKELKQKEDIGDVFMSGLGKMGSFFKKGAT